MRIAFDHQIFCSQRYGGISRYFYELAKNLSQRPTQEIRIVAPLFLNRYISNSPTDLKILGTQSPNFLEGKRVNHIINSLLVKPLLLNYRPNIVHETYYSAPHWAPSGARVIVTIHDMIHEKFHQNFSPSDTTSSQKARAVERADHVICVSEHTRRDLIELFRVPEEKTSVVHHGHSLFAQPALHNNTPLPSSRAYLLYVGKREGYKNFSGFLQAYAASKTLKENYDVLCFGGDHFTDQEKQRFRELNLNENAFRQISGNDNLLACLYRSASALVYPSLYEGFGIPPLEAMGFDCPVVCSNTSSIPEVVGEAARLFDPSDLEDMRRALEEVLGSSELRQKLISEGRKRIQRFSWDRCATETLAVYEKTLS